MNCRFISIKGNLYNARALFHKVALVIRVGENPLECSVYDKMYFTLFWIQIKELEILNSSKCWRA